MTLWNITRVQRSRKKDSHLPPNTLSVTRPGKFGNPFKAEPECTQVMAVAKFRVWINAPFNARLRVEFVSHCMTYKIEHVACWCKLSGENGEHIACHADVWIEVWNQATKIMKPKER